MSWHKCCVCGKECRPSNFLSMAEKVTCSPTCHHANRMRRQKERRLRKRYDDYLARHQRFGKQNKPLTFEEFKRRDY